MSTHNVRNTTGKAQAGASAPAPVRGSSRNKDKQQAAPSLEEAAGATTGAVTEPPANGTGLVEAVAAAAGSKGFAPRAGLCKAVLALVAEARSECAYPIVSEPEEEDEDEEGEGEEEGAEE